VACNHQNSETVLLVENDQAVRSAVQEILVHAGFQVLVAGTAAEAFQTEKTFEGDIDLLLVDVRIPQTTGPDLAAALQKVRQSMHVMLISGFPGGDLLVLNYGWYFIQKHAIATVLVERVNEVLHTPRRDQGTDRFLTEPSVLGTPA
jgi:two-component system, cell cycle sensor histidine kinase and response regulator CckA